MEVLITESVSHEDLEGVTLTDMVRFAIGQGFTAVVSSEELLIKKGEEEVFHQKFFGEKWKGVVDFLTAMSKATGLYRIEILLELISDKKPKPPLQSVEQILRELRFNADEDEDTCRYLYGFRKEELEDMLKRGESKLDMVTSSDMSRPPGTTRILCIKTNANGEKEISYVVPALMSEEEKRKFFHKKQRWLTFRRD